MEQISIFDMTVEEISMPIKDDILKVDNTEKVEYYIGKKVNVTYEEKLYEAEITRIYNNGNTINCIFDGKSTAFHKSVVSKIDK